MATASARPSIFLRRPILSSVISIIITLCGAISMQVLPIAQYPDLIPPTVAVTASYPGASAETIASTVLAPLEVQVNGVEHMLYMTSTSSSGAGSGNLLVYFALGSNADMDLVNVCNRVNLAQTQLPETVRSLGISVTKRSPAFLLFFTGGCSGSTSGGFKIIRWVVLKKQAKNEMLRMLHPHGVFTISLNDKPGRKDLVFNVAAFAFVYFMLVMISTMISTFCGLDIFTSLTASLSMTGSIGPAFGKLNPSQNFGIIPPFLKYWYCFVMIAGRLELYNLIIFLFPDYWKK